MTHPVDVPHGAEEDSARHRSGHVELGRLLQTIVAEDPGDPGRPSGGVDVVAPPDAGPGRVNGAIGVERVDLDVPHPTRPTIVRPAKARIDRPVVVVSREGAAVPPGGYIADGHPSTAAIDR
jgi:hypothetical protein